MAVLHPLQQMLCEDRTGRTFSITKVRIASSSDTVPLPTGILAASQVAVLPADSSGTTVATATITQVASDTTSDTVTGTTITLANGTVGTDQYVIAIHAGNAAGLGV